MYVLYSYIQSANTGQQMDRAGLQYFYLYRVYHTHASTYTYRHTYAHPYPHTYIRTTSIASPYSYIYIYVPAYVYTYMNIYVFCICPYLYIHISRDVCASHRACVKRLCCLHAKPTVYLSGMG